MSGISFRFQHKQKGFPTFTGYFWACIKACKMAAASDKHKLIVNDTQRKTTGTLIEQLCGMLSYVSGTSYYQCLFTVNL